MHLGPPAQTYTHTRIHTHTHTRTQSNLVGCQLHHAWSTLELNLSPEHSTDLGSSAGYSTRWSGHWAAMRAVAFWDDMQFTLVFGWVQEAPNGMRCVWYVVCGVCTITGCEGRAEQQSKVNWLSTFNLIERLRQRTLACQAHALPPDWVTELSALTEVPSNWLTRSVYHHKACAHRRSHRTLALIARQTAPLTSLEWTSVAAAASAVEGQLNLQFQLQLKQTTNN